MRIRNAVVTVHCWTSLAAVLFWLLQAATGVLAVFHWELDDATVAGAHRATDFRAIERSLSTKSVSSMWTTAGAADRYDVYLPDRVARIDGRGSILRERLDGERFVSGGLIQTLVVIHQSLLGGDRGRLIVGISGLLLLSNLLMGIAVAWPRGGQWGKAIRPLRGGSRVAWLYSWHRAAGLWFAVPALLVVSGGTLIAFDGYTKSLLNAHDMEAPQIGSHGVRAVGMAAAAEAALSRYPGAVVSGIDFPPAGNAVWKITLKQRGEWRRAYGKTRVFVSAVDGRIVGGHDALAAPPQRRFVDSLFAFHTGEMGGIAGRIVVVIAGLWLIAMIVLGINLWSARRAAAEVKANSRAAA
jgi:uncharacterized iron-regulated membrane protein